MREDQKRRREKLERSWRADPRGVRKGFDELVGYIRSDGMMRVLYTDEKREYRESLREAALRRVIRHVRISSTLPRTLRNDLFSVNYLDRELRKDCANYVRETVCFSRNVNNCMERFWVYFVYHNYRKRYRIRSV